MTAFLGTLQNLTPATNDGASSDSGFHVITSTGEIYEPSNDRRVDRFIKQSVARRILGNKSRTAWCLRRVNQHELPAVLCDENNNAHYGGLLSCTKLWDCPVCAAKISQRRRSDLLEATTQHRTNGGHLLLITYTFSHKNHDNLATMLDSLLKAFNAMKQQRSYSTLKKDCSVIGTIRTIEVTHGKSGWHPHIHEIWFLSEPPPDLGLIKQSIFDVWRKQCLKKLLGEPNFANGVDVKDGTHATKYVTKWGIEDEMTKQHAKNGKGGYTPFQMLGLYIDADKARRKELHALFVEYSKAFKGKRQLCWSRGLRKHFELMPELTDEQIALEQPEKAFLLGKIELEQWALIIKFRGFKRDSRAELLAIAERGGWDAVIAYIESLKRYETTNST